MPKKPSKRPDSPLVASALSKVSRATEVEKTVLGAILVSKRDDLVRLAMSSLDPECFVLGDHRLIFLAMEELHRKSIPLDYVTVGEALSTHGKLAWGADDKGVNPGYLADLGRDLPRVMSIGGYVDLLRERFRRAEIARLGATALDGAQDGESSTELAGAMAAGATAILATDTRTTKTAAMAIADALAKAERARTGDVVIGVPTFSKRLNELTGGFPERGVTVIAARPSRGNTSAAVQSLIGAASAGDPGLFVSLEMSSDDIVMRAISMHARVSLSDLRKGRLSAEDQVKVVRSSQLIGALPWQIDDRSTATVSDLRALVLRHKLDYGVKFVVIDRLELIASEGVYENATQRTSMAMEGVKQIAKDEGVSIVLLVQLNRQCENEKREPQMSDLRQSGAIEEHATVAIFIHREYDLDRSVTSVPTKLIISKNQNGPLGAVDTIFYGPHVRFDEVDPYATEDDWKQAQFSD